MLNLLTAALVFSNVSLAQSTPGGFDQTLAKAAQHLAEPRLSKRQRRLILRELIPIGPDLTPGSPRRAEWAQLVGQHALRSPDFLEECLRIHTLGLAIADAMVDSATAKTLLTLDPVFVCFLSWMIGVSERRSNFWFAEWTKSLGDLVEPSVYWVLNLGMRRKRVSRKTWERLAYGGDLLSLHHQTFAPSPRIMAWALQQFDSALDQSHSLRQFFAMPTSPFDLLCQEHLAVYLLEHAQEFGTQVEIQEKVSFWLSQNYQPILNRYTPRILSHFEDSVDQLTPDTRNNLARLFTRFQSGQYTEFGKLRCGATLTAP